VDPSAQEELRALSRAAQSDPQALAELQDRFSARLQFGTAGLRGGMAAGPNRMNRAVVIQAAKGLVDYLSSHVNSPTVVIGNDARHNSRQFAQDSAEVITAAGGVALLLPDPVPTPVLSFAVRYLNADAGVMVTASHNPAQDNGYKVYLGGRMVEDHEAGVQIVAPHDSAIAACIAEVPPANQIERAQGFQHAPSQIVSIYVDAISSKIDSPQGLKIVHTAMHGVGSAPALAALKQSGFTDVICVDAQKNPDPDFPTVSFPNPEEHGAIDMAVALAQEVAADLVIANDPDADRCAVAIPDPRRGWRMLHGDELGAVLAEELARGGRTGIFANSVVSSRQLQAIATHYGLGYETTLTGFKWMGRVKNLGFAYEEAIGYCVRPDLVRDKDGLSTAVAVARMVSRLKGEGSTIAGLLDDLARRNGLYLSSQLSVRFEDLSQIPQVMAKLRNTPIGTLAQSPVTEVVDLSEGWGSLPPTEGILMHTERKDQVVVRPSGTEPKLKCYLEVIESVSADASFEDLSQSRINAEKSLDQIKTELNSILFD
jgi:phosphomannomutase